MLGEFLSANVSAPWVLFMVKSESKQSLESSVYQVSPLGFNISDDEGVVGKPGRNRLL